MKNTDLYKLKISLYGTYHTIPVTLDLAEGICRLGIRTNLDQSEVQTEGKEQGFAGVGQCLSANCPFRKCVRKMLETAGFFKVLGLLRENKKETAKPYIHCFAVPNKKIGVTGFEPATSTSRTCK